MPDMRNDCAKAWDKFLRSREGKRCWYGRTSGIYLQQRLEVAFLAGRHSKSECNKEYREMSDDVLKRISLLDEECRNNPRYAADHKSILLIIRDIARVAHTALVKKITKEAHEREKQKEEECTG